MEDTENAKFEPKPLIIRITASVLVLLFGAAVFMQLEQRSESRSSELSLLTERKLNLAASYNLSKEHLALLETAIKQEAGEKDQVDGASRWTFSNSVFFVFTIMTTIGYGHMTPQTWQGQLFCIFFSLLALPVTGLMLISIGNHLSLAIRVFIRFMEKKGPCRVASVSAEAKCTIVTVLLLLAVIVFGAILTSHTDDWAFVEGAYFMFVSVSTIGFGDYVINDGELKSPDRSKAIAVNFIIVIITVGLCVLSSVLCSISAVIQEKQTRMRMSLPIAVANALNPANLPLITDNSQTSPVKLSKQEKTKKRNDENTKA